MTIREEIEQKYSTSIQSGTLTLPNYQIFKMFEIYFDNPANFWTITVNAPSFDLFCIDTLIEAAPNLKKIFDLTFKDTPIEKVLKSFPNGSLVDFFTSLRNEYRYNKHKKNMQAFRSNRQTINFIFGKMAKSVLDSWTKEEKTAVLIEDAGVCCSKEVEVPNRIGEYQSMEDVKQAIDFINLTKDAVSLSYRGAKDLDTLFLLKDKYRDEDIPTKYATGMPSFFDSELVERYAKLIKGIKSYELTPPLMVNLADLIPNIPEEDAKFTNISIYQVGTITTIESERKGIVSILYLDDVACKYIVLDERLNRFKSVLFAGNSTVILNGFNNYTEIYTRGKLLVKGNNVLKATKAICCNLITDVDGCSVAGLPSNITLATGEELPETCFKMDKSLNDENILTLLYPYDMPGSAGLTLMVNAQSDISIPDCDTIKFSNVEVRVPVISKLTTIETAFKFVSNVTLADIKGNPYPTEEVDREIRKREVKQDILGNLRLSDGKRVYGFGTDPIAMKEGETAEQAEERSQQEKPESLAKHAHSTNESNEEEKQETTKPTKSRGNIVGGLDDDLLDLDKPSEIKRLH